MSTQSFSDLGVSRPVVRALADRGITEPFAIQRLVIADVLAGRDVLAKSPTGSGKTLAFGVPMLDRIDARAAARPAALVLAPTRELATQIVDELRAVAKARGLWMAAVYGGVGYQKQIAAARRAHVIVATPGRLEDLLERGAFSLDAVDTLVLDEADRMLDMGFRPAVDRIVEQCPEDRQTLFFSATLDGEAGRLAARYTRDPARHEHRPEVRAAALTDHRFVRVERDGRIDALLATLQGEQRELALVFVRTRRGADRLAKRLGAHGVAAAAMHGDKSQSQRERTLAGFEAGRVDTLVATDVAARGLDVAGISHVINFDPPEDREGYVHRIGRTARAGRSGTGITFVGIDEAHSVERIATELALHREFGQTGLAAPKRRAHDPGPAATRPRRAGRSARG
ncbi:MAG TPA: DEAD/DEAH box helicase, partial [Solirubrobacteraceae bacterium]|nr:DEAD/DEAH box helicase [Solirubrobacteraceae bacterium]